MSYLYAILMGVIQGLTEFLPVSSSGHLVIFRMLFGETESGNLFFEILLHLGTLIAVFVAFWPDIWALIKAFFGLLPPLSRREKLEMTPDRNMIRRVIPSLLPRVIVLPIEGMVEDLFSTQVVVGIALLVTATLLYIADRLPRGKKDPAHGAGWKDALFIGFMQLIAITPGLSRSGTTITAGLFRGYTREFAVKFSFILSIPTILAAFFMELIKNFDTIDTSLFGQYVVGMITAALVGYLAIWMVRYISSKGRFSIFSLYCAAMGIFAIVWSLVVA